jgi:hypothetical protein
MVESCKLDSLIAGTNMATQRSRPHNPDTAKTGKHPERAPPRRPAASHGTYDV